MTVRSPMQARTDTAADGHADDPKGAPRNSPKQRSQNMSQDGPPEGATARLRLLGTTDLHAHLMAYDYYADEGG